MALLALAATGAFTTPSTDHLEGAGGNALLLVLLFGLLVISGAFPQVAV